MRKSVLPFCCHFQAARLLKAIAFIVLLLSLVITDTNVLALSIDEEKTLGDQFLVKVQRHFEFVEDRSVNQYITDLGKYLSSFLDVKHFPFRFYVLKDNTPNAFAAPGGHIFIFSGLITAFDKIDELASVICHEIAHVSSRHLSHRIEQNKKITLATLAGILAGALIGGEAAEALITGSLAGGIQAQLHFSREDERQADQLGFKYMKLAGFDPAAAISSLRKIEKGQWFSMDKVPTYLMTHPSGPERMANLDSLLGSYQHLVKTKEAVHFTKIFPFFQAIIRAKSQEIQHAEKYFNSIILKEPEAVIANFGMGIVYLRSSEGPKAIYHLKKALQGTQNSTLVMKKLSEAYIFDGKDSEAIPVLEKVVEIDGQDRTALLLLALSYENMEKYEKAIDFLERLNSYKPVDNEVYYHLGISYGRLNKLALAHYNFGIYFKIKKQINKSRFHFKKAKGLAGDDSSLKRKIEKAEEKSQRH